MTCPDERTGAPAERPDSRPRPRAIHRALLLAMLLPALTRCGDSSPPGHVPFREPELTIDGVTLPLETVGTIRLVRNGDGVALTIRNLGDLRLTGTLHLQNTRLKATPPNFQLTAGQQQTMRLRALGDAALGKRTILLLNDATDAELRAVPLEVEVLPDDTLIALAP